MASSLGSNSSVAQLLSAIRAIRFRNGVRCPRCGGDRVVGWGSFTERRRYKCVGCRRTFSDLTGTPAAYSKRLLQWSEYSEAVAMSLSVRRGAARVGIHRATAFRWRHAFLHGLRARDSETLSGWIEISSLWIAYSEKGQRALNRPPRTHAHRGFSRGELLGANVLAACDRDGGVVTEVANVSTHRRITDSEISRALARRILGKPRILAEQGRYGPCSLFARRNGGQFCDVRPRGSRRPEKGAHVDTVKAYHARFLSWLVRFQGVATRYLPNYLIWHRHVDRPSRSTEGSPLIPPLMTSAFC